MVARFPFPPIDPEKGKGGGEREGTRRIAFIRDVEFFFALFMGRGKRGEEWKCGIAVIRYMHEKAAASIPLPLPSNSFSGHASMEHLI